MEGDALKNKTKTNEIRKKKETYEFNIYILKNEIIRLLITRKEKKIDFWNNKSFITDNDENRSDI